MANHDNTDLLFFITKESMQAEALERIGRRLNDEELDIVRKCLDWGLSTDIDTVYTAAIEAAIVHS